MRIGPTGPSYRGEGFDKAAPYFHRRGQTNGHVFTSIRVANRAAMALAIVGTLRDLTR